MSRRDAREQPSFPFILNSFWFCISSVARERESCIGWDTPERCVFGHPCNRLPSLFLIMARLPPPVRRCRCCGSAEAADGDVDAAATCFYTYSPSKTGKQHPPVRRPPRPAAGACQLSLFRNSHFLATVPPAHAQLQAVAHELEEENGGQANEVHDVTH